MNYKQPIELYKVIEDIVARMRDNEPITNLVPDGANYRYISKNKLIKGEYLQLTDGVDIWANLKVIEADSTSFVLSSAHYNATEYTANAPYFIHEKEHKAGNVLTEKTKQETYMYQKYPLVLLRHPYTQEQDSLDYAYSSSFSLVLLTNTQSEDWSDDRYSKTISPILRPIQQELIEGMAKSRHIKEATPQMIDFAWSDLLFIEDNPYPDMMDGVVLDINGLKIMNFRCRTDKVRTFTLTTQAEAHGTVDPVYTDEIFVENTYVELNAIPDTGHTVAGWVVNGETTTSNPISVKMHTNILATAFFTDGTIRLFDDSFGDTFN